MYKESNLTSIITRVFSANFFSASAGIILIIILSRFLTVEEFGRFNFIVSTIMIAYTAYDFGFVNSSVIFINKNLNSKNESLQHINFIYHRYAFFIFLLNLIGINLLKQFSQLSNYEIIMIGSSSFVLFIIKYMQALLLAHGKWGIYNNISLINNFSKLIIIGSILFFTSFSDTYVLSNISYIVYSIFLLVTVFLISKKYFTATTSRISNDRFREIISITWPIGLQNIILIILMRSDLLIINAFLDPKDLGIYSAANQLALIFPLLTTAISTVFLKVGSSLSKRNFLNEIIKTQKILLFPSIIIILCTFFFRTEIITLMFGMKYIESSIIFLILLVINILSVFFSGIESYTFIHKQKIFLLIKLFQLIIFLVSSLLLIKSLGLYALLISIAFYKIFGWLTCNLIVLNDNKVI